MQIGLVWRMLLAALTFKLIWQRIRRHNQLGLAARPAEGDMVRWQGCILSDLLMGAEDGAGFLEALSHPRRIILIPLISEAGVFTMKCSENLRLMRAVSLTS